MNSAFIPIGMAIIGGVLYHVSQKAVPKAVSPFAAIIIAYAIGILVCAVFLMIDSSQNSFLASLKASNWSVVSLGLGAVIIEGGFLLAYRAGWNISTASVVSNITVALLLLPIGLIVFNERLSMRTIFGVAFCLLGLFLISKR